MSFQSSSGGDRMKSLIGASDEQNGKNYRPSRRQTVRLIARPQRLLSCYSCYSWVDLALFSRFSCYSWVNYGLSNNLPLFHVVPTRLDGDEPAGFDQDFGRVDRSLSIPNGVGSVDTNISCADGGFGPVLEPVEQPLRR